MRHNSIRYLYFAELLSELCKDVVTEPSLLPLTGETLPARSNLSDGARLDISCHNVWSPLAKALFYFHILLSHFNFFRMIVWFNNVYLLVAVIDFGMQVINNGFYNITRHKLNLCVHHTYS